MLRVEVKVCVVRSASWVYSRQWLDFEVRR
jgi:hypothetical protein